MILLVVVLMFSQMFFTLLSPDGCSAKEQHDSYECSQSEYYVRRSTSNSCYFYHWIHFRLTKRSFCLASLLSQLKVYAILLGDFGLFKRENFNSVFSIFLAVFFTFLTTTILLNVLIAVASDSVRNSDVNCICCEMG